MIAQWNLADIDRALRGAVYSGWKGGEYVYHRDSPVWIARPGESGNTILVGARIGVEGYVRLLVGISEDEP